MNKELVAAVATVIGCPEWTCDGCDRTGECFCEQAAEGVKRLLSEGSRDAACKNTPKFEF